MAVAGTVQNVLASAPIVALKPPPEGQAATQIVYTFGPSVISFINNYQLSISNGLQLTQVCSLVIDNTANPLAITVTHGVLNQSVIVPPYTSDTVQTYSARGNYPCTVTCNATPASTCQTTITYLNYDKQSSNFSNSSIGSGAGVLTTLVQSFTGVGSIFVGGPGNYVLNELTLNCVQMSAIGAGNMACQVAVVVGGLYVHTLACNDVATAGGLRVPINYASFRTFPTPLAMPRNSNINLQCQAFTNLTVAYFTLCMSGFAVP
jgi:hypothetical protein